MNTIITILIITAIAVMVQLCFLAWDVIKNEMAFHRQKLRKAAVEPHWVAKPWGQEEIWIRAHDYVGKILYIDRGKRLSWQYHKKKTESIRILSGMLNLHIEWKGEKYSLAMYPGDVYHIHTGLRHRMEAMTDVQVLEVSTPQLEDIVRLEDDYGRV